MTTIRKVLGVDVALDAAHVPVPDPKWFDVFQTVHTGLTASVSIAQSSARPSWNWDARKRHLHCDYGSSPVATEPGIAYPGMIFAAEVARQQAGYFSVHSGCVQSPAGGVLLMGDSGAGKTSLTLEMCLSRGWRFNSADRTSLTVQGGSLHSDGLWPFFRLRAHSFADFRQQVGRQGETSRVSGWQDTTESTWDKKLLVHYSELNLQPALAMTPIAAAYDIRVIQGHKLEVKPYVPRDQTFFFSSALSDNSTGRFAMTGKDGDLLGTPFAYTSDEIREQQASLVRSASLVPFKKIRGDLRAIATYLQEEQYVGS